MMNSRTLLNLALLLIVILLITVVVLEPGKTPAPAPVLLTGLENSDVHKIKILRKNKDSIELEKIAGQWQMRAPYSLSANRYKVDSVLKVLKTETAAHYDMNGLDPARYDLLDPAVSMRINDTLQIDFGNLEPLQKQRYVRIDKQLYLIPDYYYYQLIGSSTDYLNHALINENEKITRLELPELSLALTDGKWAVRPENTDYPADAYSDLFNEWQHAQAIELRPLTKKHESTDKPIRVFLQGRDTPIEYRLQRTEDEFILRRPDKNIEYVMAADKADALLSLQMRKTDTDDTPAEK